MSQVAFIRLPNGDLRPMDDEALAATKRWKTGDVIRGEFAKMRNALFFRKWWALITVGFGLWQDSGARAEYKGQEILPNLEKYRKDTTIMAGFYHPVLNVRGEMRLEADSISFANMTEETFEKLYSATIDAILKQAHNSKLDEQTLRNWAESIMEFA